MLYDGGFGEFSKVISYVRKAAMHNKKIRL
jgi:hypothetical protein